MRDLLYARRRGFDLLRIQPQTVEQGGGEAVGGGVFHISGIRANNAVGAIAQRLRRQFKPARFLRVARLSEGGTCLLGTPRHRGDQHFRGLGQVIHGKLASL